MTLVALSLNKLLSYSTSTPALLIAWKEKLLGSNFSTPRDYLSFVFIKMTCRYIGTSWKRHWFSVDRNFCYFSLSMSFWRPMLRGFVNLLLNWCCFLVLRIVGCAFWVFGCEISNFNFYSQSNFSTSILLIDEWRGGMAGAVW